MPGNPRAEQIPRFDLARDRLIRDDRDAEADPHQRLYDLDVLPENNSMIVSGTLACWRDALSYPQSSAEMKTVYGEVRRWLTRLGLSEFITNGSSNRTDSY